MHRFILSRLLSAIPVLFVVSLVTFLIMWLVPGDVASQIAGPDASAEELAAIRDRLGTVWGVAETGAAGPTGNRYGDAAGHTCIAIAGPTARTLTIETGDDDREANMWRFTKETLTAFEAMLSA